MAIYEWSVVLAAAIVLLGCLMSGNCYICPTDCVTCIGDNKCSSCSNPGYYLYNHACVKCPEKCVSCTSNTECTYCTKGLYGKNQCRQECSYKCKDTECDINGRCESCVNGMYGDNCNIECGQHCTRCDRSTGECLSCEKGTYLYNYQCKRCPTSCTKCTSSWCTECVVGHWGGNCKNVCLNCKPGTPCGRGDGHCQQRCVEGTCGYWCTIPCRLQCLSCKRSSSYKCTACVANKYGYNSSSHYYHCNADCPPNCLNSTCDDKTGECTFGCIDGYHGNKCKCPPNFYCDRGENCISCMEGFGNVNQNCECTNENCVDNDCSACTSLKYFVHDKICCSCRVQDTNCEECSTRVNGGFDRCIQCNTGFFPHSNQSYCTECPINCTDSTCDQITGECTLGCEAGHWGTTCDDNCAYSCLECDQHNGTCTVCQQGTYSPDCSKSCSKSCKTIDNLPTCALLDGACIDGCRSTKIHGSHCEHSCSINCTDEQCDWQTTHCVHGCTDQQYGNVCNYTCSQTCSTPKTGSRCYDTNGTCVDGCQSTKVHGSHCQHSCSINCTDELCDWQTTHCVHGCTDHHYGDVCNNTCSQTCSTPKIGSRCYDTNGTCADGCEFGNQCSLNCVNITCEQFTGSCLHGCRKYYEGNDCMMEISYCKTNSFGVTTMMIGVGIGLIIAIFIVAGVIVIKAVKKRRIHRHNETGEIVRVTVHRADNVSLNNFPNQTDNAEDTTEANARVEHEHLDRETNLQEATADEDYITMGGATGQGSLYEQLKPSNAVETTYSSLDVLDDSSVTDIYYENITRK